MGGDDWASAIARIYIETVMLSRLNQLVVARFTVPEAPVLQICTRSPCCLRVLHGRRHWVVRGRQVRASGAAWLGSGSQVLAIVASVQVPI